MIPKIISFLFERDRTVILKHINNIYKEEELDEQSTCAKNAHVPQSRNRLHKSNYYNLDVIISIGYWVKSYRGIIFRKRANKSIILIDLYLDETGLRYFKKKKYILLCNFITSILSWSNWLKNLKILGFCKNKNNAFCSIASNKCD